MISSKNRVLRISKTYYLLICLFSLTLNISYAQNIDSKELSKRDSLFEANLNKAKENWNLLIKSNDLEWEKEINDLEASWQQEIKQITKEWKSWLKEKGGLVDQDILRPADSLIVRRIIDYERGLMGIEVRVKSGSEKTSKVVAEELAIEEIKKIRDKVRVNPDKTVGDVKISFPTHKGVPPQIKTKKETGNYTDKKTYRANVIIELSLYGPGGVMTDVLEKIPKKPATPKIAQPSPSLREVARTVVNEQGPFTGLIVDTRGFNYKACLLPRLISEIGDEIYGPGKVELDIALNKGMANWARTEKEARAIEKVGKNPLLVEAVGLSGEHQIELNSQDSVLVSMADDGFLENAKVVILID